MLVCYYRLGGLIKMDKNFILDNYVWFIVVGVILFMALIGYIAEKTNFGRNQFEKKVKREPKVKKKKDKKNKVKDKKELPVEELIIEEPILVEDNDWANLIEENVPAAIDVVDSTEADVVESIENDTIDSAGIDLVESTGTDASDSVEEDLTVPFGIGVNNEEEIISTEVTLEEDLIVPLSESVVDTPIDSVVEPLVEEPVEDIVVDDVGVVNEVEDELSPPKIDTLNADTDEDVWKF